MTPQYLKVLAGYVPVKSALFRLALVANDIYLRGSLVHFTWSYGSWMVFASENAHSAAIEHVFLVRTYRWVCTYACTTR